MSLSEDMRNLAHQFERNTGMALQGSGGGRACRVCKERLTYHQDAPARRRHKADCPVLALPRVVAALEAAERLVESNELIVEGEGTWKLHCLSCEAVQDDWTPFDPKPFLHTPKCLITAMEVGVAPQESEKPTS